ncbi:uncharacterized protein LOC123315447 [Coccinella septempunctata]|uniref:uncharacterized protein LOC123315447 n=1 Tax=Coccinella septempunctata TaxID=41139 RepID=UPI001D07E872|nr:uncharacterized protein LOC123315447 [Coccinella septempunctata]
MNLEFGSIQNVTLIFRPLICFIFLSTDKIAVIQDMLQQLSSDCQVSTRRAENPNTLEHPIGNADREQGSEISYENLFPENVEQPLSNESTHDGQSSLIKYSSSIDNSDPFNTDEDEEYQPPIDKEEDEEDKTSDLSSDLSHEITETLPTQRDDSSMLDISVNETVVGGAIRDAKTKLVKASDSGTKKYSCKYCNKLVAKLARHIETVHKDEEEVKKLSLINKTKREKNQPLSAAARERLEMIKKIRAKGNFEHNMKCSTYDEFIPCRRPRQNKAPKTVSDFAVCPQCKETYSKSTLHKHYRRCTGRCSKYNKKVQMLSRLTMGDIHEMAEPQLKKIICRMRDDEITTIVRYDELIILFGNLESYKYRHSQHHGKMIRAKLRRLGRLLLELRKMNENIRDFSNLYDPANFTCFLKAVNTLGNFNEESDLFDTPATASALGMLTKELGDIWIAHCIEKKNPDAKRNAEEFLHLYNLKFGKIINKTVAESQTEMCIKKKVILPSFSDIKILHKYLTCKRNNALNELKKKFDKKVWRDLLEATLTSIQLLNRRRPGELERIKLVHYSSLEKIDEKSNLDLYKKLNPQSKQIANKYSRILLRGKLNRTVPVLLDNEMVESLKMILKYRKEAGVSESNTYLFGLPGGAEKWPSACDLMRKFSIACKANLPSTLRGTLLRKHVATCCISLNLTDGEIEDLSNFMGHDKNIHLNIYRQPVATKDILQISQLLEKAQGDDDPNAPDIDLEEVDETENYVPVVRPQTTSFQEFITPKNQKAKWDPDSRAAVMNAFGNTLGEGKLPSSHQIQQLINSTPCLRKRTVPQIRTWLHSKKKILLSDKSETSTSHSQQRRNSIPNTIYLLFADNIAKKVVPTLEDCYTMYARSPSLNRYNPSEILNLVKEAISRN